MKTGGQDIQVRAGISPNLPVSMLLRTNAPELVTLLQSQDDGGVTQPVLGSGARQPRRVGESREGTTQESQEMGPESPESDVEERLRGTKMRRCLESVECSLKMICLRGKQRRRLRDRLEGESGRCR